MHIPTVVGVVAIAYNLPELTQPLKLTGPVVADIFLGKITKWNDARIAALNPGVEASGDGHSRRASQRGQRHDVHLHRLPVLRESGVEGRSGQGQRGAVARRTRREGQRRRRRPDQADAVGAIGYVELAYAKQNQLATALVAERSGKFVAPDGRRRRRRRPKPRSRSCRRTRDYRISIVNSPGANDLSDHVVHVAAASTSSMPDAAKAKKLADFIRWALTDGQKQRRRARLRAASRLARPEAHRAHRFDRPCDGGNSRSDRRVDRRKPTPPAAAHAAPSSVDSRGGSAIGDRIYRWVTTGLALVIPILLLLIAWEVFRAGWPALQQVRLQLSSHRASGTRSTESSAPRRRSSARSSRRSSR